VPYPPSRIAFLHPCHVTTYKTLPPPISSQQSALPVLPLRSPASSMCTLGLAFLWQSRPLQPSAHCATQTRCSEGTPHPVHPFRGKGPRHFERAHSARVKVQSTLEEVHGVEAKHMTNSSYKLTSHSCRPHSLSHTSTHMHSTHSHTTQRECTSSLSCATVCCEDCSQHHTHSARVKRA